MYPALVFNILFLIVILIGQIFWNSFLGRWRKEIFLIAVGGVFLLLAYYSQAQFIAWHNGPAPAKYLVPPYQSINYFLFYVFSRYWANYLLALIFSLFFLAGAQTLNNRCQERFFYQEEPYLIATIILLTGHPLWIFYFTSVLISYFFYILIWRLVLRRNVRLSFYYFWIPVGIVFLASIALFSKLPWFLLLRI